MKKLLLSILSLCSIHTFSQWSATSITSTGYDVISAFGNVYSSGCTSNNLDITTNDGATWATSNTGLPAGGLYLGTFYNNNLYACRGTSISVRSSATGAWSAMTNTFTTNNNVKSMTAMTTTVFAGVNNIVAINWRINEYNGSAWVPKGASISGQVSCVRNLNGTLFAGTTGTCVMKSTDAGVTFTNSSSGITTPATFDKYINCLGATSTAIFAGTQGGRIWKSINSGSNWTLAKTIATGSSIDISDIYVMSNNNILVACDSGFIYSSDNGATWAKDNSGLSTTDMNLNHITVSSGTTPYIIASNKSGAIFRRQLSQIFSGINEIAAVSVESKVYPNPSTDHVTIASAELAHEINCEVIVTDVLGRTVSTIEMKNGEAQLNVTKFSKGIYSYTILNNKTAVSKGKLVVN
jgi:hypothetical protein